MSETITVIGNLADEPHSRGTAGGTPIAGFRVGSTQRRLNRQTGQWEDAGTSWYAVSAYRQLAQHVLASLHKGQRVVVTGRFKLREWDNGTRKGVSAEIDADGVGHDLLFGTTEFRRAGASRNAPPSDDGWAPQSAGDVTDSWEAASPPDADREASWVAPGVQAGQQSGGPVPTAEPAREPVPAGAGDVPF